MKIGLTIKAIIRWEQLRKKSFSLMDYTDKDDVDSLLYTTTICNNEGKMYTFDVFRQTLTNEKIVRELVLALERETAVLNQFQKKQEESNLGISDASQGLIGELVSTLIMSGLDAHYALEEMELCDLPMYIEAFEKKKKEQMENDRMWTYYSMLPHIDARKMKNGVKDLIVFPWEEADLVREAEKALSDDSGRFEDFMKTKKSDYYGR